MEGSKLESTADINEATTPMKRVLRSRIVDVDSNSSASCGSNVTDSTSSQLCNQTHEVKGNLHVDVVATPKKAVSEKSDSKCTLEDNKRPDLADDNKSLSSLSPVSQCGSEASNVSVRVLRNKCVLIKLENIDKVVTDQANSSTNKEGKSTNGILSSIDEENLEKECREEINDQNDVDSGVDKVNEEDNNSEIVDNNSKEENKRDKITNNSEIINGNSVSDSVTNDKNEMNTSIDGNDKCETPLDNLVESVDDGGGGSGNKVDEDNDSVEKEDRLIIEESEGDSRDAVHLETEDPAKSMVSLSSICNNESDSTKSKEILSERSNKDELPLANETLEYSAVSCDNDSDTTEESESILKIKKITKRKPVSTNKVPQKYMEDDSNQTQSNVEKTVNDEIVNKDEVEKEIVKTPTDSEKANSLDISIGTTVLSESNEEPTLVSEECFITERIEENCVSQDSATGNIVEDSENLSVSDKNEELPMVAEDLSTNFCGTKEQESVQEPLSGDLEVEELIDNDSDDGLENSTVSYFKSDKKRDKHIASAGGVIKRSIKKTLLESDIRSKSRLNLSNVVNLLNVDKSNINEMLAQNDILDSDSEFEVSMGNAVTSRKITKHIEPVDSPVEYYGIGKDLLKGIIKEAVEGAVCEVKKELQDVKNQLSSITTMLNGMRRGKKRKFDDMNTVDIHEETHDKESVSSLSSISTTDELMAKLSAPKSKQSSSSPLKEMKSKDDLIKELLEGVSGHLQVPIKAKKKRKLNDLSEDFKKKKKEMKSVNPVPVVKESVGLMSFSNDSAVNKMKKKKKLKLLQGNSEDLLVGGSVKNKVNDRLTLSQGVMPYEDNTMDGIVKKNKKKKKLGHDNVFNKVSDNYSIFDSQNFSNVQEFSKKKKKGNKNKSNALGDDVMILTSKSDLSDVNRVPMEEVVSKKKKKKRNISTSASSETVLSSNNEVNMYRSISIPNYDETEKKKKKKKKLNASLNLNVVGDDSPQLNKLKKKKKKLNLLNDQLSSSVASSNVNNGFDDLHGFETFSYGNSSNRDEQGLLKKMKSWKSKNKNQLYRATPYKDNKNKKVKLNTTVN